MENFLAVRRPLTKFVERLVKEHKRQYRDTDEPTDFLTSYIQEQKKHENMEDAFWWDGACVNMLVIDIYSKDF